MRRVLIALIAVEALCFGPHFFKTGFYLDDWALLSAVLPHGRLALSAGIRSFASGLWIRPLQILHYPALIAFGRLSPWRYRLVIACLELLAGSLLFSWLRRSSRDEGTAVLAAALALIYPVYGSVHIWWTMSTQWVSLCLVLSSMILHARHAEDPAPRRVSAALALGQLCYLLSLLEYEAFAFFPLALAAPLWFQAPRPSGGRRAASIARSLAPYGLSFAVYALSQRLILPRLLGPSPRGVGFAPRHVYDVYRAAFACLTGGALRLALDSAREFLRSFPPYAWAGLLAGAAAASVAVGAGDSDRGESPASRRVLAATGALLIGASYVPYVLSGVYTPRMQGVMNRVNMGGGIGAGLIAAALLSLLPRRWRGAPLRRVAVAAAIGACALCHWVDGARWSAAWRLQRRIVGDIAAQLPAGPSTVLLSNTPHTLDGAPVFQNHFDLSSAMSLLAGRADVAGNWIYEGHPEPNEVVVVNGDGTTFRYPYERLFVFEGASRRLYPVNKP